MFMGCWSLTKSSSLRHYWQQHIIWYDISWTIFWQNLVAILNFESFDAKYTILTIFIIYIDLQNIYIRGKLC